jgi:hypothetical protein
VFFTSPIALTAGAEDDVVVDVVAHKTLYAENVYEYHEGRVSLISDGKDLSAGAGFPPHGVELLGSDDTGTNVFFSTADPLVAEDTNGQLDIYDAHMCTSEQPCFSPKSESLACEGEACHGLPPSPSVSLFGVPGSATFQGAGNVAPVPVPPAAVVKVKTAAQIRAERLAKALRVCRGKRAGKKRAACERAARQAYGARKAGKASKAGKARRGAGR